MPCTTVFSMFRLSLCTHEIGAFAVYLGRSVAQSPRHSSRDLSAFRVDANHKMTLEISLEIKSAGTGRSEPSLVYLGRSRSHRPCLAQPFSPCSDSPCVLMRSEPSLFTLADLSLSRHAIAHEICAWVGAACQICLVHLHPLLILRASSRARGVYRRPWQISHHFAECRFTHSRDRNVDQLALEDLSGRPVSCTYTPC